MSAYAFMNSQRVKLYMRDRFVCTRAGRAHKHKQQAGRVPPPRFSLVASRCHAEWELGSRRDSLARDTEAATHTLKHTKAVQINTR